MQSHKHQQQLGFFSLTMIVVSLVIGMGIFKTPAVIAAKSGTTSIFYTAWLLGGFIALCGALTYAEIGLRLPVVGGYYKVFAHAYHPVVGFTINALILISNAASLAVVALIGADYAADFWYGKEASTAFNITIAIIPIILFYGVNLLGLKTSSTTQNILTIIKISLIVLLIAAVFKGEQVAPHGYNKTAPVYTYNGNNTLLLLMLSLVAVSFTYGGYQQTINFGGEVKRVQTMQKGIVMGIFIVILLYLSIAYAYVQVIGFDNMKNATAIGALLCEVWFGKAGGKIFDLAMFLSVMAYVNVLLMSNPRVMYAMSEDGVFPKIFTLRHARTKVLIPGLTLFAAIAIIVTFFGKEVDDVLSFSIFLDCFGMSLSAATLLILRKRKQGEQQVTKGLVKTITPVLCIIFVLAYVIVATAVVIDKPMAALTGVILMLIFTILYFLFYHKKKLIA
jgi:APA family basic amino acid/polyamine antiporter